MSLSALSFFLSYVALGVSVAAAIVALYHD